MSCRSPDKICHHTKSCANFRARPGSARRFAAKKRAKAVPVAKSKRKKTSSKNPTIAPQIPSACGNGCTRFGRITVRSQKYGPSSTIDAPRNTKKPPSGRAKPGSFQACAAPAERVLA